MWLYQPVGLAGESMRPIGVMAGVTILICIFAAVLAYFITSGMVSGRIERLTHHAGGAGGQHGYAGGER